MTARAAVRALVALAAVATLSACSQMAALTPVGGDSITTVRNAVYDVLVEQNVDVLLAPQCTTATDGFTCAGTTMDGQDINAVAGATSPYPLTITVGGTEIFRGTAQDVLQVAVEGES